MSILFVLLSLLVFFFFFAASDQTDGFLINICYRSLWLDICNTQGIAYLRDKVEKSHESIISSTFTILC